MKRPPGLWLLLSAGVLWLSLRNVYGIRATALIFGKSTTTTTTGDPNSDGQEVTSVAGEESVTEPSNGSSNVTKPTLTGIPQIDYIYDPNLPQELNGYNLSEYPFYERVPEEIDFKCDGLHDGFYASVPHKCQVYHHCLFGTRYDFLCANYTAFDQKTFICHFVSEVDCVNSKNFWHRNDALYKPASTTTLKPQIVYTRPPVPPPFFAPKSQQPAPEAPPPVRPSGGGKKRGPARRRRPQYEYYDYEDDDDYYEDPPPKPRRRRPRPRRPVYEDDYLYEDEEPIQRGNGRRRNQEKRPYDRRASFDRRRNKNRNKYEEDDYYDSSDEDRRRPSERYNGERRRTSSDRRRPLEDVDYERRRPGRRGSRRPVYYDDDYEDDYQVTDRKSNDKIPEESDKDIPKPVKPTGVGSSIYDRPRGPSKIKPPVPKHEVDKYTYKSTATTVASKPKAEEQEYDDDYEYELPESNSKRTPDSDREEVKPLSRPQRDESRSTDRNPTGSSTRVKSHAVRRPERNEDTKVRPKFNKYKPLRSNFKNAGGRYSSKRRRPYVEEYYDDYYDDSREYEEMKSPKITTARQNFYDEDEDEDVVETEITTKRYQKPSVRLRDSPKKDKVTAIRTTEATRATSTLSTNGRMKFKNGYSSQVTTEKTLFTSRSNKETSKSNRENQNSRNSGKQETTESTTTPKETTTQLKKEVIKNKSEHFVRIVKRPFLPSRGGNPFTARGLQPVGLKAQDSSLEKIKDNPPRIEDSESKESNRAKEKIEDIDYEEYESKENLDAETEKPFRPSPLILKVPIRKIPEIENQPVVNKPKVYTEIRHSYRQEKRREPEVIPKLEEQPNDPLDINEYDVTLNDALNPTIPNLPIKGYHRNYDPSTDYTYNNFQRNKYTIDPVSQASTDYNYRHQIPYQQYERFPSTAPGTERQTNKNLPESTQNHNRGHSRYETSQHTQAYFSSFR